MGGVISKVRGADSRRMPPTLPAAAAQRDVQPVHRVRVIPLGEQKAAAPPPLAQGHAVGDRKVRDLPRIAGTVIQARAPGAAPQEVGAALGSALRACPAADRYTQLPEIFDALLAYFNHDADKLRDAFGAGMTRLVRAPSAVGLATPGRRLAWQDDEDPRCETILPNVLGSINARESLAPACWSCAALVLHIALAEGEGEDPRTVSTRGRDYVDQFLRYAAHWKVSLNDVGAFERWASPLVLQRVRETGLRYMTQVTAADGAFALDAAYVLKLLWALAQGGGQARMRAELGEAVRDAAKQCSIERRACLLLTHHGLVHPQMAVADEYVAALLVKKGVRGTDAGDRTGRSPGPTPADTPRPSRSGRMTLPTPRLAPDPAENSSFNLPITARQVSTPSRTMSSSSPSS